MPFPMFASTTPPIPSHGDPKYEWSVVETLSSSIMNSLRVLQRAIRDEADAVYGATGLTLAQLFVLRLLNQRGQSLADLARASVTDIPSVTVVARRLEELGLVVRSVDGNGVEILWVSGEGRRRCEMVESLLQPHLIAALRWLDTSTLVHLDIGLRRCLEYLGYWNDHPAMFGETAPEHPRDARAG